MQVLVIGVLCICAAIAGFIAMLVLVGGVHNLRKLKDGLLPYFFYATFFSNGLLILLSPRNFAEESTNAALVEQSSVVTWAIRLTSLLIMLGSIDQLVRYFSKNPKIEFMRALCVITFVGFWITSLVIPAYYSPHTVDFQLQWLYTPALILGLLFLSTAGAERTISACRNAIVYFCAVGLLLILVEPGKVLDNNYTEGFLPGIPRFVGLTPHAITLGINASVALWCLVTHPIQTKWKNRLAWGICTLSLILAQSKTVWVSTLVGIPILLYYKRERRIFTAEGFGASNVLYLIVPLGIIVALFGAFAYLIFAGGIGRISDFFQTRQGALLLSFTGRDQIWENALREWRSSPIFGYGLTLFDFDYRKLVHMPFATDAHNQFYDALGRTGVVGFIGLLCYLVVLFWLGLRFAKPSRGLSAVLALSLLIRSISEVPFEMSTLGLLGTPHYLLVAVIASCFLGSQRVLAKSKQRDFDVPNAGRYLTPNT